jgi:inorganic pyrophosphatase
MAYQDVPTGKNPPNEINIIIEIQRGGGRNKYEFDKNTGRLTLDRVNGTTATYPADYGYIPGTLCEDGDPLDALLLIDDPIVHGAVVPARPIAVLYMIDEGEGDEKLICVPANDISKATVITSKKLLNNSTPTPKTGRMTGRASRLSLTVGVMPRLREKLLPSQSTAPKNNDRTDR